MEGHFPCPKALSTNPSRAPQSPNKKGGLGGAGAGVDAIPETRFTVTQASWHAELVLLNKTM